MMIVVVTKMAQHVLNDRFSIVLAIGIFIVLQFSKIDKVWVVLGGTAVYWFIHVQVVKIL